MNEATNKPKSTILDDVEITGSLDFKGELAFGGQIKKGSITGDSLLVEKSAMIDGDVMTESLRLSGKIIGNVTVMNKCELSSTASLTGDLVSNQLAMEEGATLIGQVRLGPSAKDTQPGKKK
jgi:cytoskeletal protein CcmA (bactofilin family)